MNKENIILLLGFGVGVYVLHALATNWMMNTSVRACNDPSYSNGQAICSCIKTEARATLIVEKAVFGSAVPELERIMRQCKAS